MMYYHRVLIVGQVQCLSIDTEVCTRNGWKKSDEIESDDEIYAIIDWASSKGDQS